MTRTLATARALFTLVVTVAFVGCGRTRLDPFELFTSGASSGGAGSTATGGSTGGRPDAGGTAGLGGTSGSPGLGGTSGNSGFGGTSGSSGLGGSSGGPRGGATGGGVGGRSGEGGGAGDAAGGGGRGGEGGQAGEGPLATGLGLGAFHSCVRFDDGGLRCWGTGGYIGSGDLRTIGDDETPDVLPDVDIGGDVLKLAASWYHTCALLDGGRVRCFGNGISGELGYGNVDHIGDDEHPASAGNVNLGGRVTDISAGPYHTCASLENGKVRCWGRNDDYALGYPDTASIGDDESPVSAGFVDVGGFVVEVAAGWGHTCVRLDDGKVRCWGNNNDGRLGYGNTETIGDDETPASAGDVDLGGEAIQIVAGSFHNCALLVGGRVRCWGRGFDGRLGYGIADSIGDDETPASAGDVDVGGTVLALAAGDYATCALLTGGRVRCWGSGELGELGYGNTEDVGDDETPASAGDVDLGGPATSIDVGFLHGCATLETGAVRCWGRGSTGALGYGNTRDIGDDETPASAGDVKTR